MNLLKKIALALICSTAPFAGYAYSYGYDECCDDSSSSSSWGVEFYAEYLYWKVAQDNMQYAGILPGGVQGIIDQIEISPDQINIAENASIVDPSFEYKSGFRIGLAYAVPCSTWDFSLSWARLHDKTSSSVTDNSNGIIPLAMPASVVFGFIDEDIPMFGFANRANSQWKFEYDSIDFQVGKVCTMNSVKVRPYVGLKAVQIRQNHSIDYLGFDINDVPVALNNTKKNNFRGIGPSFGVDGAWEIWEAINLTSGISGSLLCGKFNVSESPSVAFGPNSINFHLNNTKKDRIVPAIDARIGIDWNPSFFDGFNIVVGVAYEVQYYFNQWRAPSSVISNVLNGGATTAGDLVLYGLTASVGVGF